MCPNTAAMSFQIGGPGFQFTACREHISEMSQILSRRASAEITTQPVRNGRCDIANVRNLYG